MIDILITIWLEFRICFTRGAAYHWFIITLFGFIVRLDHYGITSHIRWLRLKPDHYETFLAFFRADSWTLSSIIQRWVKIIENVNLMVQIKGANLLLGDGIKGL